MAQNTKLIVTIFCFTYFLLNILFIKDEISFVLPILIGVSYWIVKYYKK